MYRQGNLLIVPMKDSIPYSAQVRPDGIILRGEATGHAHRVDPSEAQVIVNKDRMFLRVLDLTHVTHEEHAPIQLAPGEYEIRRQREFDGRDWRYGRNVSD